MDWKLLLQLMQDPKDHNAYFVKAVDVADDIGPHMAALATCQGGKLIIGIDIRNYHFLGTDLTQEWLEDLIQKYCNPFFQVKVDTIKRDEKHVICVTVLEGKLKPYYYKKNCYILETDGLPRLALNQEETEIQMKTYGDAPDSPYRLIAKQDKIEESLAEAMVSNEEAHQSLYAVEESKPVEESTTPSFNGVSVSIEQPEVAKAIVQEEPSFSEQKLDDELVPKAIGWERPEVTISTGGNQDPLGVKKEEPLILNNRQKKVISFLREGGGRIKNKEYRQLMDVSHKTAHLELVDLVTKQLLLTQGMGRSTCYVLNPDRLQDLDKVLETA